jgi:hypothetical protein
LLLEDVEGQQQQKVGNVNTPKPLSDVITFSPLIKLLEKILEQHVRLNRFWAQDPYCGTEELIL